MSTKTSGHVRKYLRKHKIQRAAVLRVFAAIMENQAAAAAAAAAAANTNASGNNNDPNSDYHNEFFSTGRIGRRNALPDILGYNCTTTTADLPLRLSALTTNDTPSTSGVSHSTSSSMTAAGADGTIASTSAAASCSSSTQPVSGESMNTT